MNDYSGISTALVSGIGIGDLPPIVAPDLIRCGKLVEVMTGWPETARQIIFSTYR